jgi:phosphoribosylformimino-5-aminoimidazole carboxamide ribotide isomerase
VEIIPVIDVLGGKVVHASGGIRSQYPVLQSVLSTHCEPLSVIADLLAWHAFSTIYIADLDAILDQQQNNALYKSLVEQFPQITFLLDAGIHSQENWRDFVGFANIKPVIGSETLSDIAWLSEPNVRQKSILSLDFQHGQFLGEPTLLRQPTLWAEMVIAMNIDHIGSQSGPDFELLSNLQNKALNSEIIAAGGVRSEQDLVDLASQGIARVLVASALHDGRITKQTVEKLKLKCP